MAAKVIRISDDAGANWTNLPGSQGTLSSEAEAVDDTIFGQTYGSTDIGLVGWSVSSDGIFKGFSGYLAEIKKEGTSTALAGTETFTLVSGKTYQIDDATKEIWDRSVAIAFLDGVTPIAEADILNVDYLFGRVTFVASFTPGGAITTDGGTDPGAFFPTIAIGKANTYSLTMTAEAIDETDFATAQGNSGTRIFKPGLRSVALELGGIQIVVASTHNPKIDLRNRTEVVIEIDPAGDGSSIARGFFKLATVAEAGAVGALEEETLNYALTVPDPPATGANAGRAIEFPFNWQHTNTTLNSAIQFALTSWLTELNTYDVQYLPQGAPGQTPLDGIEGNFIVTDISLSGGLSNMNVFTIELQGTGQFTEV